MFRKFASLFSWLKGVWSRGASAPVAESTCLTPPIIAKEALDQLKQNLMLENLLSQIDKAIENKEDVVVIRKPVELQPVGQDTSLEPTMMINPFFSNVYPHLSPEGKITAEIFDLRDFKVPEGKAIIASYPEFWIFV